MVFRGCSKHFFSLILEFGGGFNPKKPKPKMGFQTIFGFFGFFGFFGVFLRKRCGKYLSQHS